MPEARDKPDVAPLIEEACARFRARDARGCLETLMLTTRLDPSDVRALNMLARLWSMSTDHDQALSFARRATEIGPGDHTTWIALGDALIRAGDDHGAVDAFERARALQPNSIRGNLGLAEALQALNRLDEAMAAIDHIRALDPGNPRAELMRGFLLMQTGRLGPGLAAYESRFRTDPARYETFDFSRRWRGEPLAGKRVLIASEQGFGDLFQMLRFVPMLKARGATTIVEARAAALPLARLAPGVDEVVEKETPRPDHDLMIPLMSLPHDLGMLEPDQLWRGPYLARANSANATKPRDGKLRVGFAWRGSPTNRMDRRRSMDLATLAPIFDVPGIEYLCLSNDMTRAEAHALARHGVPRALAPGVDFAATATALAELDLVVTIDSAVAHLAGAMGMPVWVMLCFNPDWRWGLNAVTSPWYPSARLFRQQSYGDWAPVVATLARCLDKVRARGGMDGRRVG